MVNETVVLALLLGAPKHGYRLLEEADVLIGPDETFDTKRLYTTLRRLEEKGAVVAAAEQSPRRGAPQRKVYSITPAGLDLLRGLVADPENALDRRRFFVSLSLWVLIPPRDRRLLLARRIDWLEAERRHMEGIARLPDHTPWSRAVYSFQLRQVAEERQWLEDLAREMGIHDADD